MIWSTQPPPQQRTAADAGFSDHIRAFLSSALGYIRARLELAGIEGKEATAIYGKIIGLLIVAVGFLLFGYIFLCIGGVALIALWTKIHWGLITLGIGVLHLLGTAACLWLVKQQWGEPIFTETIRELRKDQEWLSTPQQTAKRN